MKEMMLFESAEVLRGANNRHWNSLRGAKGSRGVSSLSRGLMFREAGKVL